MIYTENKCLRKEELNIFASNNSRGFIKMEKDKNKRYSNLVRDC